MEIEFKSEEGLNYYTGNYSGKQKFTEDILSRFRDKINYMIEAETLNDLSKIRSLNIEKYEDHWSARINKQYRIEFEFIKPKTLVILKISKHYEK
jgi:plasmid maintenance system killer protein